jgi:hypothetical protein
MVNVALLAVLLFRVLKPRLLTSAMSKKHDKTVERFAETRGRGCWSCLISTTRHFPLIFGILNFLFDLGLAIALYVYFDGNCYFNNFRTFDEDDEFNNSDYTKGFLVMLFFLIETMIYLNVYMVVFDWRNYGLGSAMYIGELILNVTILGLMVTTNQCMGDTLTNRYWISGGLYIFYAVWEVFLISMTLYLWASQAKLSPSINDDSETSLGIGGNANGGTSTFGGDAQIPVTRSVKSISEVRTRAGMPRATRVGGGK